MIVTKAEMEELSNANDENFIYKDIVIIGNGPGGICLSYMLTGNWPYYTGEPHPGDEMLVARLNYITNIKNPDNESSYITKKVEDKKTTIINNKNELNTKTNNKKPNKSLLKCSRDDLETLAMGLEGRGTCKPLALLLDQLQHPCVDAGLDLPSLLSWKSTEHHPDHKILDHIVLGKGPPGGAWQFMDPNVLTISLTRWMSLPGIDLRKWEKFIDTQQLRKSEILHKRIGDNINQSIDKINTFEVTSRIPVGTVAAYYKNYVHRMGLSKYFKSGRTVTSVRPILDSNNTDDPYGWIVKGHENQSGRKFYYKCKKVVLATGTTNSSNRLGIPGEESQSSWITHDLNDLESRLDRLAGKCSKCLMRERQGNVDPVLIIGAGLSAADAIMAARSRRIPVIHAFRDSSVSVDTTDNNYNDSDNGVRLSASAYERLQSLPVSMYPEYHKIYEMMADGKNHRFYKALPGYSLIDFGPTNDFYKKKERKVTLKSPSGQIFTFNVSIVAVLIGSKPDLSYLGEYATKLGKINDKPIDGRSNPIDVDDITYEVIKSPRKGLYAMGPLVGDNFVRFIVGGAFGIAANIINSNQTD